MVGGICSQIGGFQHGQKGVQCGTRGVHDQYNVLDELVRQKKPKTIVSAIWGGPGRGVEKQYISRTGRTRT